MAHIQIDTGLEAVIAAETKLSDVDGLGGRLVIAGYEVATLAANFEFETLLADLWQDWFSSLPDEQELQALLGTAREQAFVGLPNLTKAASPVEALRLALASVPDGDSLQVGLSLVAMCAVATAAAGRASQSLPLVPPDPSVGHCEDMLRMMTGRVPTLAEIAGLNAYLVTVSDHGLNASTFAARVVASTQAGLSSAVIAGFSALKGPLHGGAPGPVLDMLDEIATPENAEAWIEAAFGRGERLMGFGHRIYKVRDPRADALKTALGKLPKNSGRLAFAEAIEATALKRLATRYPARSLQTNVEYYTALLLEALNIPRETFTCVFACGRVMGWIAHAQEQVATGRIVRPQSRYVGPASKVAA